MKLLRRIEGNRMSTKANKNTQIFETDDPDRIQDIGWTFREVWRRTRGFVVTTLNITIFFILYPNFLIA